MADAAGAILDLNGFNQTIGSLSGGGNTGGSVTLGTATITTGGNNASTSFAGVISGTGGLVKTGTGTMVLTGSNTYTGATTISNGTLALVGGSQASPVTVSSGASLGFTLGSPTTSTSTFDLTAGTVKITGTPTLNSYTLITASTGITGTPTLDAPITGYSLQVSGNSLLLVLSATPYDTWASSVGLDGTNNAKSANPSGDGKNNLYKFATDGNPLSGANDGKVVNKLATIGGDQVLTLTLPVRSGAVFADNAGAQVSALIDGIYYRIEGSPDLVNYTDTITEVTGTDATAIQTGMPALSSGWTYRTFRVSGTVASTVKDFIRSKVSETP